MKTILNIEYGMLQGAYWMLYSLTGSFVSVFLLGRGYSNSDIGVIMAAASVAAIICQPLLADASDKIRKITLARIIQLQVFVMLILSICLIILKSKSVWLTLAFIALYSWHTIVQPLVNSLCYYLQRTGYHINFGICRSAGSLLYAAITAVMGIAVEKHGVDTIPETAAVICLLIAVILEFTERSYKTSFKGKEGSERKIIKDKDIAIISMKEFLKRNRMYFIFSTGVIGIFFGNSGINTFMIQITQAAGGSESDMGMLLGYMAALEIPGLILYDWLRRKFSVRLLLGVSCGGFLVKIFIMYISESVAMLYFAMTWQLIAFGLYLAAMVDFINTVMSRGEAVRGQTVYTIMVTVGTVLSSIIGGWILDNYNVKMFLGIATLLTAAGMAVIMLFSGRLEKKTGC